MTGPSRIDDGWAVVGLVGLYGDSGWQRLDALIPSLADDGPGWIGTIIDLTALTLLDPVVISWILHAKVQLDSRGRKLRLVGVSPQHLSILELRGLADTFTIFPDVDSARSG